MSQNDPKDSVSATDSRNQSPELPAPLPRRRTPGNFPVVLIATFFLGAYWGLYYFQRDSVFPRCGARGKMARVATEPAMGVGPKFESGSSDDPACESDESQSAPSPAQPSFILMSREMTEAVNNLRITTETQVEQMPTFTGMLLDGKTLSSGDLRGKPVFINFWATWCAECEKEIPILTRIWEQYKGKGIVILGVNWKEPKDKVQSYAKFHHMNYPILLDTDGNIMKRFHRAGTEGVPETYLIDTAGRRVGWLIGPGDWDSASGHKVLDLLSEGKGFQAGVSYQAMSVSPKQMEELLKSDPPGALIVDLRDHDEYDRGHISKWAISAPPSEFMQSMTRVPYDVPQVLISSDGVQAAKIAQALASIGFQHVGALDGGMQSWKGTVTKEVKAIGGPEG
ncbi:MAG: redoxin domain-containing protein [bacterium]